jgi:hypothetical protein
MVPRKEHKSKQWRITVSCSDIAGDAKKAFKKSHFRGYFLESLSEYL